MAGNTTRRDFVKQSATMLIGGGAALSVSSAYAADRDKKTPAAGMTKGRMRDKTRSRAITLDRNNLGKLSEHLFKSPRARQKFIADPQGYAKSVLGGNVTDTRRLQDMKQMFADGICCHGCGC